MERKRTTQHSKMACMALIPLMQRNIEQLHMHSPSACTQRQRQQRLQGA